MKKWKVVFEVYREAGKEIKDIIIEAGNKKIAMMRAMVEINNLAGYSELFKKVNRIEEVA